MGKGDTLRQLCFYFDFDFDFVGALCVCDNDMWEGGKGGGNTCQYR